MLWRLVDSEALWSNPMEKITTHPSHEELSEFGLGKLDEERAQAIARHLGGCNACCDIVDNGASDTFVKLLQNRQPAADEPGTIDGSPPSPDTSVPDASHPGTRPDAELASGAAVSVVNVPPGLVDHPRYRIVRLLGKGGMGAVYLAEHIVMRQPRALKVINAEFVSNPQSIERFRREIQTAARLDHPNIVRAYDAEQSGQTHFLVMEYVEGTDLASLLKRKGPLPVAHSCHFIRQAALGLEHAREKGMVHRDIKPHNMILARKSVVKILDFGLAKVVSEAASEEGGATRDGVIMGTPDYMAPEQWENARTADIRADIYSLGCTLYALLTGAAPFQDTDGPLQKMVAHVRQEPRSVSEIRSDVPVELRRVVARMLAKNPDRRFQQPGDVARALLPFIELGTKVDAKRQPTGKEPVEPTPVRQTMVAADSDRPPSEVADQPTPGRSNRKASAPARSPWTPRWKRWVAVVSGAAALCGTLALAAGVVLRLKTSEGTVELAVNVDNPEVLMNGKEITVNWDDGKSAVITVKRGARVEVKKDGFTADGENVILADGSKQVLRVSFSKLPNPPPDERAPLDRQRQLVEWVISRGGYVQIRAAGEEQKIAALSDIPSQAFALTAINLDSSSVQDPDLARLRDLPDLRSLRLWNTKVSGDGLAKMTGLTALEELALYGCHRIDDAALAGLQIFPELSRLDLGQTSVTDAGLERIARLSKLKLLGLWYDSKVTDAGLVYVARLQNLSDLGLVCTGISNAGLFHLKGLAKLKHLQLGGTLISDAGLDSIKDLAGLEQFDLNHTNITDAGLGVLSRLTRLRDLQLAGTAVTAAGYSSIRKALPACQVHWEARTSRDRPPPLDCTGPSGVSAEDVRKSQEAWANYLGRNVEETVDIANGVKMTFVLVPPGRFVMGSPEDEPNRQLFGSDETRHTVVLREPFDLGKYEVTQAQYAALVARLEIGHEKGKDPYPSRNRTGDLDRPVEQVSWNDADSFGNELTALRSDKYTYRLPTEAEWEFSCRGGRPSSLPFGTGDGRSLSSRDANLGVESTATCKVGSFKPNQLGLYDMHGNVWEWCADRYGPYPKEEVIDPTGPQGGPSRVNRGGCWGIVAIDCRAARRSWIVPGFRDPYLGFRVARSSRSGPEKN
jgi:serine/threonine protein kinase/formylglycine-generating enzyme required for sulfatase activity